MLDKIIAAFPQISKAWLVLGEGEMLNSSTLVTQTNNGSVAGNMVAGGIVSGSQCATMQPEQPRSSFADPSLNLRSQDAQPASEHTADSQPAPGSVSQLLAEKNERIADLKEHISSLNDTIASLRAHINMLEQQYLSQSKESRRQLDATFAAIESSRQGLRQIGFATSAIMQGITNSDSIPSEIRNRLATETSALAARSPYIPSSYDEPLELIDE